MAANTQSSRPIIGLIGMGEMGKMYAEALSKAGGSTVLDGRRIHVCDLPSKYYQLVEYCKGKPGLVPMVDGHHVSRSSDFIVYSVEAEYLDAVVKQYGPSTKMGAIVAGQTSVKAPERAAFDKHLPSDVKIVSIHSLHGPTVSPEGQALIIIQHRASQAEVRIVEQILAPLKSRYVHLTYDEHDEVTANTQAVTHAAFLTMGTAWRCMQSFPWETGRYIGGIEVVKINIALRIYAAKWHVYAGLAILNPTAKKQIKQYAQSVSELFKLMIIGKEDELRERVFAARDYVFTRDADGNSPAPILLSDKALDKFEIGAPEASPAPRANSHLSLLAMVDCWHALKIRPFDHLAIGATPVFRFWIGVAEYLFRSEERLEHAIHSAVNDITHRSDDAEFLVAARGWSECVGYGNFEAYRLRFEETAKFFEPRFEESRKQNAAMFKFLAEEPVRAAQGKVEPSS
ncbi:BQ5605_C042g12023 [Microbotryum silenes-dioicae]|uniref:Prephenate dehydrogenase [NADP(+)] n=1 Tax=Microbotryum silenes-dioicae TaxID=796604 RepID=A0A2X0MQL5_9BASI|nr:BQ5605_C042g12023 [Microbotryum silenes-dioicae]